VEVYESQDLYFLEAEQHFEVCIKMGDYKEAKLFINETFNNYLDGSRLPSIHILQFKILGFMNIFLNAIRTKSFEYNELKKIRAFSGILRCRTINDMKNELLKILDYTDELYDESFAAATSNAGENILNYIKEHFTDPNLNVNALSTFFKINISLLSRIIKNKTGTGPLEIIQRLRLEKAKSLLKNTSSLNKVAEEVGLLNDVALIRLFRKFENTTPGRYKDILSKNDNG
jgi:AraC-like DNA-binding protein